MADYRRAYKKPLPRRSRTRPIYGRGDDRRRFYRCWNCGFVCDSRRDELGDSDSNAGDDHTDFNIHAQPDPQLGGVAKQLCLGGDIGHYHVAMKIGADSEPQTIVHSLKSDVSRGCPFCGTVNWRGDY
jgi:hypothetical protein